MQQSVFSLKAVSKLKMDVTSNRSFKLYLIKENDFTGKIQDLSSMTEDSQIIFVQ